MERIIPIEILKDLVYTRGMVLRSDQRITLDQALPALMEIGRYMVPGFTIDPNNEFAYMNVLRWCINDPAMECYNFNGDTRIQADPQKGLYIYGNVGTGKSVLLDVFRVLCLFYKFGAKYGDRVDKLAWKTYRSDTICDMYMEDGDLKEWKDIPCLGIQDLGSEPAELLYMGNRRRVLRSIIEARGDVFDRLTIISSNIPPSALGEVYGPRVQSRIAQMCNVYRLGGPDRRK